MGPCSGHWFCNLTRVQVSKDLLYATQFGDGVDFVGSQGIDELFFVILEPGQ